MRWSVALGEFFAHLSWDPAEMRALGNAHVKMSYEFSFDVALAEGELVDAAGQPREGMGIHGLMRAPSIT